MDGEEMFGRGLALRLRITAVLTLALIAVLGSGRVMAQVPSTSNQLPDSPRPQNNAPAPPEAPPAQTETTGAADPAGTQAPATEPQQGSAGPAPAPEVRTMPPGTVVKADEGSREQLWNFRVQTNFITVPVTVKDRDGHLVDGLLANNFAVYEEGVKQNVRFFTSDPFPLSAAVVIDVGMSDVEVAKVRQTLPALIGAFGQFDEIAIYSYGNTVKKWQDLAPAEKVSSTTLKQLKGQRGGTAGAPVVGGPLGQPGPIINGRKMDNSPNIESLPSGPIENSRVLNDAILMAAQDLAKKDRARRSQASRGSEYRKILFVISDGREFGSTASYADVMKVLLTNDISVYAIGVGGAAIPGYNKLGKITLPRVGSGNLLPKYSSATGGQVFAEFTQQAVEAAYARVTEEARNQYTIGYTTRATPSTAYRSIEVRVNKPGLRVYARDGYYPLPPARAGSGSPQP